MEKQPKKIIDYDNCNSVDEINNLLCVNSDSQLNLTNKDIANKIYNTKKWNASIYSYTGSEALVFPNNNEYGIYHVYCSVHTNDDEFVGDFLLKSPILYLHENHSKIGSSEIFPYEGNIGVNQVVVNCNFDMYGENKYYDVININSLYYSRELLNCDIDDFYIEDSYGAVIYNKSYSINVFDIVPDKEYELYIDGELIMTETAYRTFYNDAEFYEILYDDLSLPYQVSASFVKHTNDDYGNVVLKLTHYDDYGVPFTFSNITIKAKEGMAKTQLYTDIHNVYFQPIRLDSVDSYDETEDISVSDAPQ